jgi:Leucine-rich repeat (LRR) protein
LTQGLAELHHLKKLVILNVAENQVSRIPVETLRHLKQLKALVLNNNSITTLEWVPSFPELNSLIVSHNRIPQLLPRTIDRLPNLTKISMTHNLLEVRDPLGPQATTEQTVTILCAG